MVGTVHHIDMNKANCTPENLVFLCQSCHLRLHAHDWKPPKPLPAYYGGVAPKWITARKLPYQIQLELELKWTHKSTS
jgi:hypothetical protein